MDKAAGRWPRDHTISRCCPLFTRPGHLLGRKFGALMGRGGVANTACMACAGEFAGQALCALDPPKCDDNATLRM